MESFFSDPLFFSGGALSTFIHLSLGKAGPFTLENYIHVKALKMQGVPYNYIDALLNPCQKTAPNWFDDNLVCTKTFGVKQKHKTFYPPFFG